MRPRDAEPWHLHPGSGGSRPHSPPQTQPLSPQPGGTLVVPTRVNYLCLVTTRPLSPLPTSTALLSALPCQHGAGVRQLGSSEHQVAFLSPLFP